MADDVLYPGEEITFLLDCDDYDVLVTDELGTDCELYDLDICFDDAYWIIDNRTLERCDF